MSLLGINPLLSVVEIELEELIATLTLLELSELLEFSEMSDSI
jgi:hypothetical protein